MNENRLEEKIDKLMDIVSRVNTQVQSMDATIKEREKSEILRNEVLSEALKTQTQAHNDLKERVCKLEENQSKVVWYILGAVIVAVMGTILVV